MATAGFCGLKPLLFRRKTNIFEGIKGSINHKKSSKTKSKGNGESLELSFVGADQLILMVEIHKKILAFRDIMDLAPCNTSASLREMVLKTLHDLQGMYPAIIPKKEVSKIKDKPIDQAMAYFCNALKSLGESWMVNDDWMKKLNIVLPSCKECSNMRQLGETMLATLDCLMKLASERFDIEEDDHHKKDQFSPRSSSFGKFILNSSSFSDTSFSCCSSPATPRSVLPAELMKFNGKSGDSPRSSCASPLLLSLRVQAVGKLNPIDVKRLSMSPTHDDHISKASNDEKHSSEDLVFHWDTTEEFDSITNDHEKITPNLQVVKEEGLLSPSPEEPIPESTTPSLTPPPCIPQPPPPPSPPPSPPFMTKVKTIPPPPPPPAPSMIMPNVTLQPPPPPVLQPNVATPPPPPPPPPALKLEQSVEAIRMPPLPPPPPMPSGSATKVIGPPPPPPPPVPAKTAAALPPPMRGGPVPPTPPSTPRGGIGGAPPPPPPLCGGRTLRAKATTKLKRSTQLGNLYRTLKGKVEGCTPTGKSAAGKRVGGASAGGKQGMADALAEMTKRSSYFQQIEEDVQTYSKQILELRSTITNFKTKEMTELVKFHKDVESILENLTDESQVLSRFEGFPTKKLEALRMGAALFNKLNSMLTELQNWKIEPPMAQQLEKVERYFSKIKTELDALERTKDEESKKFKSQNIEFDFQILIRIKEALVDVSSNCMELSLKEKRSAAGKNNGPKKEGASLLWKAFQFAFRVYTFAGGLDDRADKLTRELAQEIESEPNPTPNSNPNQP